MIARTALLAASLTLIGASPAPNTARSTAAVVNPDAIDRSVLHVQVILDHLGFSPGLLDGRRGQSLTNAVKGFQQSRGLSITGEIDQPTLKALSRYQAWRPTRQLRLSAGALAGPYVNPTPENPVDQARLASLAYRSPMEKLAEMFHTTPAVLMELNSPTTRLTPGTMVTFPNALPTSRSYPATLDADWRATLKMLNVTANAPAADHILVDKSEGVLKVFDADDRLVAQFNATTGSSHDPLPIGDWKINGADTNPKFHYNPKLFWDVSDSKADALLPPGPNGPVGVVWLDLSKEHYGIHGTPEPQNIGRTQSHGCIRLTNWDAARLSLMVKPGTKAVFQP